MLFQGLLNDQIIFNNGYSSLSPLVSIITPTYCRMKEGFLEQCIQSIQAQTFSNYEHIIIDDGSTDGSETLIRKYAQNDSRIVYVRHENNSGFPAVRTNEGILMARGQYIAFAFDDNRYEPTFLETMLHHARNGDADIYYSVAKMPQKDQEPTYFSRVPLTLPLLLTKNLIANGTVLIPKTFFETIGLYDPHIIVMRVCDWDLWIRAARAGCKFQLVDEVLSEEQGMISDVSLGNTVYLDWKLASAYVIDEASLPKRTQALLPANIHRYDMLDPHVLLPFARDYQELLVLDYCLYEPFIKKHPMYKMEKPIHDGLFRVDQGMPLYPLWEAACCSDRPRILLVCNLFNPAVEKLKAHLQQQLPKATILPIPEVTLVIIEPKYVDLILLVDCSEHSYFIDTYIPKWAAEDIPVGYCTIYGFAEKNNKKPAVDLSTLSALKEITKYTLYYPDYNVPMSKERQNNALKIMQNVDFVINASENPCFEQIEDVVPFDYFETHNLYHWALVQHYMKGKNCFVTINSPLFAGSEVYGVLMAGTLKALRLNVNILLPSDGPYENFGDGLKLIELANSCGINAVSRFAYTPGPYYADTESAQKLAQMLQQQNAGLLFCSSLIADAAIAAEILKIPSIFALFSPAGYRPKELGLLRRNMSGIVSDTQRTCDVLHEAIQLDGIRLLDPLDDHMFERLDHEPREIVHIAMAGTLIRRKQQLEVVQACANLIEQGYSFVLNIYGNNTIFPVYVAQIESFIKERDLTESFIVHGFVNDDREIVRNNDLIVTASIEEGLPQGILFNMAAGLVVVTTPAGGLGEIIIDGETGYISESFGVTAFQSTLKRALDDRENWPKVIRNAQTFLKRECSPEKIENDLLAYLAKKMAIAHRTLRPLSATQIELSDPVAVIPAVQTASASITPLQTAPIMARPVNRYIDSQRLRVSSRLSGARNYQVVIDKPSVSRIGMIFADASGKELNGVVDISIYCRTTKIRFARKDLKQCFPHEWTYFDILPLKDYQNCTLTLEIELKDNKNGHVILFEDIYEYSFLCKVRNKLGLRNRKPNLLYIDLQP